jgi:hypothetical protein
VIFGITAAFEEAIVNPGKLAWKTRKLIKKY